MSNRSPKFCLIAILAVVGAGGCARTPQMKAARFIEQGNKHLEKKDYPRAVLEFMSAMQADPTNAEAYYRLALAHLATGQIPPAIVALRKAIRVNPKHASAQVKLAELMTTSRSMEVLEDVQSRLREVLKASPDNVNALDALALAEFRLGKSELAEQHLIEALQKFPQNLKTSAALAGLKLRQGDRRQAEAVLKKAVAMAPQSSEARVALAEYYRTVNRYDEAEAEFRAALSLDSKNGIALLGISALQERAGHIAQAEETIRSLAALPEQRYKPLYGMYLYQNGKKDAAIAEFDKLARQDAEDRAARTRLISAYMGVGRIANAEKTINAALRRNPKDGDALVQRSEIYLLQGKSKEAERDLIELSGVWTDSGAVHYLLAKAKQANGATQQAKQELGTALRLTPRLLIARIELARRLTAENSAPAALNLLNEAPASQHKMLPFIIQRNWELLALRDYTEVRKGVDEGLALARSPELLLQDAMVKTNQHSDSSAQAALEEALKQTPDDMRIVDALAENYRAQKQSPKAADLIRQYALQHSQSAAAQRFLGNWLWKSGDHAGGRKAFESSKALDPTDADADLALAQIDIAEGKLDAARNRLSPMIGAASDNLWAQASSLSAEVLLANVEEMAGNHGQAVEHYRHVAELNPTNSMVLNNLAYLLVDYANQPDEALKFAQRAKELDPNSPAVSDTIGWAFYRKGIYRTAVEHLTVAASAGSPLMKYHLAMAYLRVGDSQRGQQVFQEALRLNPNLPEARMAMEVLREVRR